MKGDSMNQTPHTWKFFRAGGFDQVRLETGADLMNLDQLDQKLWVALACPMNGLEFDPRTFALIDTDKDGRVRAPELIAAVRWAGSMLKNPDDLIKSAEPLPLAAINDTTSEGKRLLASAKQILANLCKKDDSAISLADASDATRIFVNTTFNGDGVIIPDSASDDGTKAVINDIATCLGTTPDRCGRPGIDQARVDTFFAEAAAFDAWHKKAEDDKTNLFPAGEGTAAAAAAVRAIKPKVDDYFGRCRVAAYDPRTVSMLNRREEEYLAALAKDVSITATEIASFPLAAVAPDRALPLRGAINPAHASAVAALEADAVKPLLGDKSELREADWAALQAKLGSFDGWMAAKAGAAVEKLGLKRVREILVSTAKENVNSLLARDRALEPEATSIANVEKLTRYVRDLHRLCINFVNFKELYDGGAPAIFQCGTLYLDQRSCSLCLTVEDTGKHGAMAGLAGAYLAYCDCMRKGTGEKMTIVAVFSQGDDDNLMVGRNGIFYDRKGRDYDATITKILANPISLRQAFWQPYKKFARMIEEMTAKRASAAEAASTSKLEATVASVATADKTKPVEPKKIDVGTVAALGVAFGAIGGFLTAAAAGLVKVAAFGPLAIVGAIIAVMALISGPSIVLAFIKLRKRNLGPILDANGWAVNARAKVNVPFGTSLTGIAKLPPGSQRDLTDRFAEKKSPWPKLIGLAFVVYIAYAILNNLGYIHEWTGGRMGIEKTKPAISQKVGEAAPTTESSK